MNQDLLMQLRRGAAIAHAVPDSVLRVRSNKGWLTVSHQPGADESPCRLRHALATALRTTGGNVIAHVHEIHLENSLLSCGGLVESTFGGVRSLWFATMLAPQHAQEVLQTSDLIECPEEYCARLIPDPPLSVTLACVSTAAETDPQTGRQATTSAYNACAVEELIHGIGILDATGTTEN